MKAIVRASMAMEWPSRDRRSTRPGPYSKMSESRPVARRAPGPFMGPKVLPLRMPGLDSDQRRESDCRSCAADAHDEAAQRVDDGFGAVPRMHEVHRLPAGCRPRGVPPAQAHADNGQVPPAETVVERQPGQQPE